MMGMRPIAVLSIATTLVAACFGEPPALDGAGPDTTVAGDSTAGSTGGSLSSPATSVGPESAEVEVGSLDGLTGVGTEQVTTGGPTDCTPPPSGIVGLWHFDGDAIDRIARVELVPHGGVDYAEGHFDDALLLNGIDAWVENAAGPILGQDGAPFSVEAWVYLEALDRPAKSPSMVPDLNLLGRMVPSMDQQPNGDGWRVFVAPDDHWSFCLGRLDNGCQPAMAFVEAEGVATALAWTHVVVVRTPMQIRLFVDGQISELDTVGQITGAGPLVIGASTAEPAMGLVHEALFYGRVDELALYDGALTDEDVARLYGAALPKCDP